MLQKAFSFGGLLLLAGATVLATPGLGQAQRGGGRAGGGHFSGAHVGGYRGGAYRGGATYGGYRYGGARYGGYHYGSPYALYGYGYRHPYYGSYGTYPYVGSALTYDSGYSGYYGNVAPYYGDTTTYAAPSVDNYQAFYPPATVTAPPDTIAHVTVQVPADAQVWFDGTATTSTGLVRQFNSPPLTAGRQYTYQVRARWNENGQAVTQTQQVRVTAGSHANASFPVPATITGSAVKKG